MGFGYCLITGSAHVCDSATLYDSVHIAGHAQVRGLSEVKGCAKIHGHSIVTRSPASFNMLDCSMTITDNTCIIGDAVHNLVDVMNKEYWMEKIKGDLGVSIHPAELELYYETILPYIKYDHEHNVVKD